MALSSLITFAENATLYNYSRKFIFVDLLLSFVSTYLFPHGSGQYLQEIYFNVVRKGYKPVQFIGSLRTLISHNNSVTFYSMIYHNIICGEERQLICMIASLQGLNNLLWLVVDSEVHPSTMIVEFPVGKQRPSTEPQSQHKLAMILVST